LEKVSDQELVNDLIAGDPKDRMALKVIYQRNYPKISHMVIQKSGTEEDAKDVFQDSMIAFHKIVCKGKFRGDAQIDTLIYAIARNLWYLKLRKEKNHSDLSMADNVAEIIDITWGEFSRGKLLRRLINELSVDCQKLIKLFYFEKWAIESIQTEFGLKSIQASKNKKYRCMKELMELIKKKNLKTSSF